MHDEDQHSHEYDWQFYGAPFHFPGVQSERIFKCRGYCACGHWTELVNLPESEVCRRILAYKHRNAH